MAEGQHEKERKVCSHENSDDDCYEQEVGNMPDSISQLHHKSLAGGGSTSRFMDTDGVSTTASINKKTKFFKMKLN